MVRGCGSAAPGGRQDKDGAGDVQQQATSRSGLPGTRDEAAQDEKGDSPVQMGFWGSTFWGSSCGMKLE